MERSPTHRALMRLTLTSLLAALIFCATFFLRIPIGAGYIHAGDGFVFISAVLLPAPYAAAAAAIRRSISALSIFFRTKAARTAASTGCF